MAERAEEKHNWYSNLMKYLEDVNNIGVIDSVLAVIQYYLRKAFGPDPLLIKMLFHLNLPIERVLLKRIGNERELKADPNHTLEVTSTWLINIYPFFISISMQKPFIPLPS